MVPSTTVPTCFSRWPSGSLSSRMATAATIASEARITSGKNMVPLSKRSPTTRMPGVKPWFMTFRGSRPRATASLATSTALSSSAATTAWVAASRISCSVIADRSFLDSYARDRTRPADSAGPGVSAYAADLPLEPLHRRDSHPEQVGDAGLGLQAAGRPRHRRHHTDIEFFAEFPHRHLVGQVTRRYSQLVCNIRLCLGESHLAVELHPGDQISGRAAAPHPGGERM